MKLSHVRLNKDVYVYAAGRSLSGTISGPAEVIGPWVKVSVTDPHGMPVEVLIWGAHTLPSEILNEQPSEFVPIRTMEESLNDILGDK